MNDPQLDAEIRQERDFARAEARSYEDGFLHHLGDYKRDFFPTDADWEEDQPGKP